jgi:hypothetical protein
MNPRPIIAALAVALTLTACAVPVDTTDTSNPAAPAPAAPAEPAPVAPAPEPEVDAAAAAQIADISGRFQTTVQEVAAAAGAYDLDSLGVACLGLTAIAEEGKTIPPLGIPEVDAAWSAAMDDYANSGRLCSEAAINVDADALGEAVALLEKANAHIVDATNGLDAAS